MADKRYREHQTQTITIEFTASEVAYVRRSRVDACEFTQISYCTK